MEFSGGSCQLALWLYLGKISNQKDQNKTNEAAAANAANDDFNRALSACLTGRGYSVQ